jgi:phosphatidate cytidylyltransferase
MLKTRILTVAVILPLFMAALFFLDTRGLALLFGILLAMGLREWAVMSGIQSMAIQAIYVIAGLGVAALVWLSGYAGREFFMLSLLFWIIILFRLWRYSSTADGQGNGPLALLDGYLVLLPALLGLLILVDRDAHSPVLILIFFFIIWSADTGAYLVGRKLGRHKLAPSISPGKTIEGLLGGLAGAMLVAVIAGTLVLHLGSTQLLLWLLLAAVIALFSVAGDLFESVYKRRAGLKDSGNLLPGHGGVLDRIDSLCAALPVFILSMDGLDILSL